MQSIGDKWDEIKENIKREYDLTEVSFDTWVKPLRFFDVQEDVVTILIPSTSPMRSTTFLPNIRTFFMSSYPK